MQQLKLGLPVNYHDHGHFSKTVLVPLLQAVPHDINLTVWTSFRSVGMVANYRNALLGRI